MFVSADKRQCIEAERDGLVELEASAINLAHSICKDMLEVDTEPRAKVGELASFASGDGIAVSILSDTPTADAHIPVYGGNGIAGYTAAALTKVPERTVVIGRVGAYCGKTYYVEGKTWVSDNALFATSIAESILPRFLSHCLSAANLNRLSTGGAQPLINQQIVKSVEVPVPPIKQQQAFESTVQSILSAGGKAMTRVNEIKFLKQIVMEGGSHV